MNLSQPPEGILDPDLPWSRLRPQSRLWIVLKARLTGRPTSEGHYSSYVNISEADADKLIENLQKDPRGYPSVDQTSGHPGQWMERERLYQEWLVEAYLNNTSQPEVVDSQRDIDLIINEVEEQQDDDPIVVQVNVPEVNSTTTTKKKRIRAPGIKNTIKKRREPSTLTRMVKAFDRRLEDLIDSVQNPEPVPPVVVNKKPKKVAEVVKKSYKFKPFKSTSANKADNFNEYLWGKLGSAFSLAGQARSAAKESGAEKQKGGFFLKKALLHEFGGDRLSRGLGTLSSDPTDAQDPSLSKGQRFAARVSQFIKPPSDTLKPRPVSDTRSYQDPNATDKVPVKDTSLHDTIEKGLKKIQLGYGNLDASTSKEIKKPGDKKESILEQLAKSFVSLKKEIKDSNELGKKENQLQQKQNAIQLNLFDSLEGASKEASLEQTSDVASTRSYTDPYGKVKGNDLLGGLFGLFRKFRMFRRLRRFGRRLRQRFRRFRTRFRPRIRARLRLARRWATRNIRRVGNQFNRFGRWFNKSGVGRWMKGGGPSRAGGGLLRGLGGLGKFASRFLRIPVLGDMLFPEAAGQSEPTMGPDGKFRYPDGSLAPVQNPSPQQSSVTPQTPIVPQQKMSEGGLVNLNAGGVNAMIGEAGPEMWFTNPAVIPSLVSSMSTESSIYSGIPVILGTVSKTIRDAGPAAAPVRPFIENIISPIARKFGKPQYNLTTDVGKNINNIKPPKDDSEEGLFGMLKKVFKFMTGQDEEEGGGSESPSTTPSPTGSDAGGYKELLDMIAGHESTSSGGYEAFNTGGSNNGYTAYGSGDSSKVAIGGTVKPLTQRTVAEVMRLQAAGHLHATGRYQIIQKTLEGLMNGNYGDTGVKPTDLYDAVTQDKLGIALIKYRLKTGANVPNFISEWRGLAKENPQKLQAAIDNANAVYTANPNATATAAAPSAPPGSPTPPGANPSLPTRAVGDSIAQGVSDASGAKDHATPGHNPQAVLSNLKSAGISKGNTGQVVLSTGLSNNPTMKQAAVEQMQYLQSQGIPFTVLPVSEQISKKNGNLNAWLSGAARQAGGTFASGATFTSPSSDRTQAHPESYLPMVRALRLSRS